MAVKARAVGVASAVVLVLVVVAATLARAPARQGPGQASAATEATEATGDARSVFEAARGAQAEHRFHDAREGFLRALAMDPTMADARYQLALLTHEAGADGEARHHLAELEAIAPTDPRIPALKVTLHDHP